MNVQIFVVCVCAVCVCCASCLALLKVVVVWLLLRGNLRLLIVDVIHLLVLLISCQVTQTAS